MPTFLAVGKKFWGQPEDNQGPIILVIIGWLIYRERAALLTDSDDLARRIGFSTLLVGLVVYIIGRSQEFFQFDVGSLAIVLLGLALSLGGRRGFRRFLFPAFFVIFLIPVPPSLLDRILVPLKLVVSSVVTNSLFNLGYPIAQSGVVLIIGQYQLLIADACAGLHSMLALSGIGFLYVYLVERHSKIQITTLIAAAIPIAFLANVMRVSGLVLITYYFGDHAGSRFHDVAGYVEVFVAFGCFFLLDFFLVWIWGLRSPAKKLDRHTE
jgi:exosortase